MVPLPCGLGRDSVRIAGRGQPGGLRGVRRSAARMGGHVRSASSVTCRSGRGDGSRVANLARGGVCTGREGAHRSDPHFATGESPDAVDGFARATVTWCLRLEQGERPLGAVGRPHGQHPPIVLAQRQGTRLAFHFQRSILPHRSGSAS